MDFNELWKAIVAAMKEPLEAAWVKAKGFAEAESKKIAQSLVTITKLHLLPKDRRLRLSRLRLGRLRIALAANEDSKHW